MLPWILCCVLLLANLLLLCWIHSLHSGIEDVCSQFSQRLEEDTNNLIYVSSQDPHIRRLAARLCMQLDLLRCQRHRYENGDRELKEAIANISHDLRTPLTAICGYLELLEQEEHLDNSGHIADHTTDQKQAADWSQIDAGRRTNRGYYLAQIRNRTETMKDLTEQLFTYSLIVSDSHRQPENLTLNGILEESLAACYTQLKTAGITPLIQMPEIPVHRILDKASLERIFNNILDNAAKYSSGDLTVCLTPDGQITFSNSAPDLTPVMAERLFDRFYTVETARRSTGLGLSIAKVLTERMGGTIAASCQEGQLIIELYFRSPPACPQTDARPGSPDMSCPGSPR